MLLTRATLMASVLLLPMASRAAEPTSAPISGLPTATSTTGGELLPCVQGGVTRRCTVQQIVKAPMDSVAAEAARALAAEAAKASQANFFTSTTGDVVLSSGTAGAQVRTTLGISAIGSITAGFDGRVPGANWLRTYAYGDHASFVGLSPYGDVGLTGASRNTDNGGAQSASIGTVGFNFNYNTVTPAGGWGGYFETRHAQGAGVSQGIEIDATEFGTAINPTAYYGAFSTAALWLASGGGCIASAPCWNGTSQGGVASDASVAIGITNNGAKFLKGIVVRNGSVTGCDGTTPNQTCTVLEAGRGSQIVFDDPLGSPRSVISADAGTGAPVSKIKFTDQGVAIQNAFNVNTLRVVPDSSDVNGIVIAGATSGNSPTIIPSQENTGLLLTGNGGSTLIRLLPFVKFGEGLLVASLPSCDAAHAGWVTFVTDAASPAYNAAVTGGGIGPSASVNVLCNGAAWTAH